MASSSGSMNIYQGDDYAATVTVFQGDGTTPADLTGYTARAQIRRQVADQEPTVIADLTAAIAGGNIVSLSLNRNITATLAGRYVWDLELIAAAGTVTTIIGGPVAVTQEVTRLVVAA